MSAAGQAPDACADVAIFGVRGAFEPYNQRHTGMGATLSGVAERIIALLDTGGSTMTVSRCGVDYPANTWIYFWSRRRGVATLTGLLTASAAHCPEQRFVLLGLSQGAEVVRRVLASARKEVADRVAAAVVLGDPTRRPSDPWQHGTADSHPGVAARFAVSLPSELHDRMWGYTLDGDEVAANHSGLRGLFRSGTHTFYEHNRDDVQDQAASFTADMLQRGHPGAQASPSQTRPAVTPRKR